MSTETINGSEWYTLSDLVRLGVFPFCGTDIRSYRAAVKSDLAGRNILKTVVKGEGMGVRYSFKGSNIIRYKRAVEEGKVRI